jgi:large subunit ribosomal protein L13
MENKTHTIDAKNKVLGRLAVEIALLLRGKGKRSFAPHIDSGDSVVVKNIKEMKFTGRKAKQKIYYRHSGYLGSLRETTLEKLFEKNPAEVLRKAVLGMLPKNRTRAKIINRLKIEK